MYNILFKHGNLCVLNIVYERGVTVVSCDSKSLKNKTIR